MIEARGKSLDQEIVEIIPQETKEERELREKVNGEVVRFCGKYIDEIEAFNEQLADFRDEEKEHFRRQSFYKKMEGHIYEIEGIPLGGKVHKLGGTALAAAFKELAEAKHSFVEQREELSQSGEIISRAFSVHMLARVPETTQAILNDTQYVWSDEAWNEGVITTRFKQEEHGKTIVQAFCARVLSKQFFEKYLMVNSVRDRMVAPRLAAPRDWQKLMDDLRVTALFKPEPSEESEA